MAVDRKTRATRTFFVVSSLLALGVANAMGANTTQIVSFEEGAESPSGWTRHQGGSIALDGHTGARSIGGKARSSRAVWSSGLTHVEAGQSWRVGAWFKVSRGEAFLRASFEDSSGRPIGEVRTPVMSKQRGASEWRYTALETDAPPKATGVRLSLVVRGEALCDDVTLTPLIANLLYNPTSEGGSRNRVTFWDPDPIYARQTQRAGAQSADPTGGRDGSSGLKIVSDSSWWPVRNITQPIPVGLTTFKLTGWARWQGQAPDIAIAWSDYGSVLRGLSPATPRETVDGWTRFEVEAAHPPAGAELMTASLVGNTGTTWFDDFSLEAVAPATNVTRTVRVHVNQVGYERNLPKSCVVATNFVPAERDCYIELRGQDGSVAKRFPLSRVERIHDGKPDDWGEYFWRGDFSEFRKTGRYTIAAVLGGARGESFPFAVGEGVLFDSTVSRGVDFFFVQRCGYDVPGWHAACHLDGANLPDGTHINATGGWHSAGDYNKLMYENGDGGVLFALMEAYRTDRSLGQQDRDNDGMPDVLDEARWGADFVAKMQIPETGALRKDVSQGPGRTWMKWSVPEVHTDNIVGTEDDPVILPGEGSSPLAVGGWVRLARALEERGQNGSRYRSHARRLWEYMTQGGTAGFSPHSLLSALAMFEDSGDEEMAAYARRCVDALLAGQRTEGRRAGAFGDYGEYVAGALGTFALRFPDDPRVPQIRSALSAYVRFCVSTAENPFGLAKQSVGEPEFFFEPTSTYGHNFEVLARAWAALLAFRVTGENSAALFALDQIDWVMGKNPYGLCMFEGAGSVNPPRYHHRYDSIPGREAGAVPGAIPNGFVRTPRGLDQPGFDLSRSRVERAHPSYRTSEPWLVHNMWHLLAMSELHNAARMRR